MVLPSDHHIADEPGFRAVLEAALESARRGTITTVGIEPTRPDTGYGYIELGESLGPLVRRGVRFVEKPDKARAEEYIQSGRFVWNSGMFFFRAADMRQAIREHLPRSPTVWITSRRPPRRAPITSKKRPCACSPSFRR